MSVEHEANPTDKLLQPKDDVDIAMRDMQKKSEKLALIVVGGATVSCAATSAVIFLSQYIK